MIAEKIAVLCPGQGAHDPGMLAGLVRTKKFDEYYAIVSDTMGCAPLDVLKRDPSKVNTNLMSSMLTILASSLSYSRLIEVQRVVPAYFSGYSIGQLTSLHLAGCFDFAHLVTLIKTRAEIVQQNVREQSHAMLAVIGVLHDPLEQLCKTMQSDGHSIFISNFNCAGQYSLAGTKEAIEEANNRIAQLNPKRVLELPVEYAWHCPLVASAVTPIANFVRQCDWQPPQVPVIDCATGEPFPHDVQIIKEQYLTQIANPVRWDKTIKTLVKEGCVQMVEVGYGNMLTKFGFFIDRSVQHEAFYGDQLALCAE